MKARLFSLIKSQIKKKFKKLSIFVANLPGPFRERPAPCYEKAFFRHLEFWGKY
jgi:hypothetical protein